MFFTSNCLIYHYTTIISYMLSNKKSLNPIWKEALLIHIVETIILFPLSYILTHQYTQNYMSLPMLLYNNSRLIIYSFFLFISIKIYIHLCSIDLQSFPSNRVSVILSTISVIISFFKYLYL